MKLDGSECESGSGANHRLSLIYTTYLIVTCDNTLSTPLHRFSIMHSEHNLSFYPFPLSLSLSLFLPCNRKDVSFQDHMFNSDKEERSFFYPSSCLPN